MLLKVVNEKENGEVELIEFSPTMKDSHLIIRIVDEAKILRPLESTDQEDTYLWEKDIVEFEYENKKCIGIISYEQCMWIVICKDIPNGYIELRDLVDSDGDCSWVKVKKIGNKYTDPDLLKKFEE
jgi:hypothetical protein